MSGLAQLLSGDPARSALHHLQGMPIGTSSLRGSALDQLTAQRPGTFEPIGQFTASMGPSYQERFGQTHRQEAATSSRAMDAIGFASTTPLKAGRFAVDYYGTPVNVLQNPTPKEMAGFLGRTKYKAARRLVDPNTGDTFLWDAADPAIHRMMADNLGVPWSKGIIADMIGLD